MIGSRKHVKKKSKEGKIKMASYLHRTAQPPTLATFRSWGSSAGAGRIRLADAKLRNNCQATVNLLKTHPGPVVAGIDSSRTNQLVASVGKGFIVD